MSDRWVAKVLVRVDDIACAPSFLDALQVSRVLQVLQDVQGGPAGDPDPCGYVIDQGARVPSDHDEDMPVVRQESPRMGVGTSLLWWRH